MNIISKKDLSRNSIAVITQLLATINGIETLRKKKYKRIAPASEAQLAQQQKIKLATHFLRSMTLLLQEGFGQLAYRQTAFNAATSYTLKNAITGVYPDCSISYPNILISQGHMPNVLNPTASMATESQVLFPGKTTQAWVQTKPQIRYC